VVDEKKVLLRQSAEEMGVRGKSNPIVAAPVFGWTALDPI
jgi:hypothetical protein